MLLKGRGGSKGVVKILQESILITFALYEKYSSPTKISLLDLPLKTIHKNLSIWNFQENKGG